MDDLIHWHTIRSFGGVMTPHEFGTSRLTPALDCVNKLDLLRYLPRRKTDNQNVCITQSSGQILLLVGEINCRNVNATIADISHLQLVNRLRTDECGNFLLKVSGNQQF